MNKWFTVLLPCFLAAILIADPASAQTTVGGLFAPWHLTDQFVDADAGATFQNAGHLKGDDGGLRLSTYESAGRWRLSNQYDLSPTLGYSLTYLDFHSKSPRLPDSLTDASVGFASPIAKFDTDWFAAASGAVGYAGDVAFGDSSAWYGRGAFLLGKDLGNNQALTFGVEYDGNRTILPDVPLPGFSYTTRPNDHLIAILGFPYNYLFWEPDEHTRVEISYSIPTSVTVTLGYLPVRRVMFFTQYLNSTSAYHVDSYPSDRRIFFDGMRVEAGVRWQPYKLLGITAAAGYAFSQELHRGFDTRDMTSVARLSDEPYMRFALEWKY